MNTHKPKMAYFALLRPQNQHIQWLKDAVARDNGRNAPTDAEIDEYCELYNIHRPKNQWWNK